MVLVSVSAVRVRILAIVISVGAIAVNAFGQQSFSGFSHSAGTTAGMQPSVSLHQLKAPEKAREEVRRAAEDFSHGRAERAKGHVEAALKKYSDYSLALAIRAMIEFQEYDDERALADVKRAITVDPACGLGYLTYAELYNSTGHFQDAIALLQKTSQLVSWSWQYHFELGKAHLGAKDYLTSRGEIETALKGADENNASPHDLAMLHFFLGWVCQRLRDIETAKSEYAQALRRDPKGDVGAEANHQLALLQ